MNQPTDDTRMAVAARIEEAGLDTRRFADLEVGQSRSRRVEKKGPDEVGERYGIHCGDGLLVFDIDRDENDAYTEALDDLPQTFTVRTPNGSEQRYYKATEEATSDILYATFGCSSVALSWGQIYTSARSVIGPGSCNERYGGVTSEKSKVQGQPCQISEDREIAELVSEQLLDVLIVDPDYRTSVPQSTIDAYKKQGDTDSGIKRYEGTELWEYSPKVLAVQTGERRLMKAIQRLHNHPENTDGGILMWDLLRRDRKSVV